MLFKTSFTVTTFLLLFFCGGFCRGASLQQDRAKPDEQAQFIRLERVAKRLMSGADVKLAVCGPEDEQKYPGCSQPNAWAFREQKLIMFSVRGASDLQSEDEVACILAHEAGHVYSRNQVSPTTLANQRLNENDADAYAIPMVMMAGYDARACPTALKHIVEHPQLRNLDMVSKAILNPRLLDQNPDPHGFDLARENRWRKEINFFCNIYTGNGSDQMHKNPACR